jgi:phage FluMu protein Com
MTEWKEVRCSKCQKLLCKVKNIPIEKGDIAIVENGMLPNVARKEKEIEIKCPRCNTLNQIDIKG